MKILTKKQIEQFISIPEIMNAIEGGFTAYSRGETTIPPVATLNFDNPHGDCHIKYGYENSGKYYVVKIASGFPDNAKYGIPSGNGLMLLFDKKTGALVSILLDDGLLTDLRTGAAGSIAAKYLAPSNISCIGIVGSGAQAFYQLKFLQHATDCKKVLVWGRDPSKAHRFIDRPEFKELYIEVAENLDQLTARCNLIVTTTCSDRPLLHSHQIRPGTHITAVGADDIGKQELDPLIFAKADRVVVDSRSQCAKLGDTSYAIKQGLIPSNKLIELGEVIADKSLGRTAENQITVADLTGVAIQDLKIAAAIFEAAI